MAFIFDPSKGETPESIARKREIAEALAVRSMGNSPRNVGEGLNAIGQALAYRRMIGGVNAAEAAGRQSAAGAFDPIMKALQWSGVSSDDLKPDARAVAPQQRADNPNLPSRFDFANADPGNAIRKGLVARGLPEHVADAFVMNFKDESGLNPGINEIAPTVPGSRGGFGLAQWTGPRRKALEAYAAERGAPVGDANTQLDFLMTELHGPEARAYQKIIASPDSGSAAAAIVNNFLRPAEVHRAKREAAYLGTRETPQGFAGVSSDDLIPDARAAMKPPAVAALDKMAGTQVASLDPSIGLPPAIPPIPQGYADMGLSQDAWAGMNAPDGQIPQIAQALGANNPGNIGRGDGTIETGDFPPAPPPPQAGPSVQQLLQAAQNQWLNDNQRAIVNMLLEKQLKPKEYGFQSGRDGSIFRTDSSNGTIEQVYGGKPDKFRVLTNEEEAQMGLDQAGAYQIGADNKVSKIGGEGTTVNIDQKTEGAFDKKLAEKDAETYSTMSTEGMNAKADLGIIAELDSLLQGQGGTLTGLKGWAAQKGFDVGEATDDLQAAQALINKLVPTQRQPGSGSMSDRDVELFTRSLPSLWNQPGGNQKILNVMRGLAQYKAEQGRISDAVLTGEISRQEARKQLQALPNPLAEFQAPKKADGEPARPTTDEEYNALPSGSLFIDPDDGKTYRKP